MKIAPTEQCRTEEQLADGGIVGWLWWMIGWADESRCKEDAGLHRAGRLLLGALLRDGGGPALAAGDRVKVITAAADTPEVLPFCQINENVLLLLSCDENPLRDDPWEAIGVPYAPGLRLIHLDCEGFDSSRRLLTGTLPTVSIERLLTVLEEIGGGHPVVEGFRARLEARVNVLECFRTLQLAQWTGQSWEGFFRALQGELGHGADEIFALKGWGETLKTMSFGEHLRFRNGRLWVQIDTHQHGIDPQELFDRWQTIAPETTLLVAERPEDGDSHFILRYLNDFRVAGDRGCLDFAATAKGLLDLRETLDTRIRPALFGPRTAVLDFDPHSEDPDVGCLLLWILSFAPPEFLPTHPRLHRLANRLLETFLSQPATDLRVPAVGQRIYQVDRATQLTTTGSPAGTIHLRHRGMDGRVSERTLALSEILNLIHQIQPIREAAGELRKRRNRIRQSGRASAAFNETCGHFLLRVTRILLLAAPTPRGIRLVIRFVERFILAGTFNPNKGQLIVLKYRIDQAKSALAPAEPLT